MKTIHATVQIVGGNAFIAALTAIKIEAIKDISGIENSMAVVAVLTPERSDQHVAVFIFRRVIRVQRIFALGVIDSSLRNRKMQLMKLLKKTFGVVKITAIIPWVPCITPPIFRVINNVR